MTEDVLSLVLYLFRALKKAEKDIENLKKQIESPPVENSSDS